MHGIYELKEKLCKELEGYGTRELNAGSLDVVDKLAHTIKNLDKILEGEDGYSSRPYMGRSYEYSRRRDSMGRYSREGMADRLRDLMGDAPDDHTRQEIQRLIDKM